MDDLDPRIVRELIVDPFTQCFQSNVRVSYSAVANKLAVDEDTVRNRIDALGGGFLLGWRAGINPRAMGLDTAFMLFDVRPSRLKERVLREMSKIPGMIWTIDHLGNMVSCLVAYQGEESLRDIRRRLLRISNAETFKCFDQLFPDCSLPLMKTDLDIIDAMQTDPRKPFEDVSKELRISTRTVRRHIQKLTEGKAIFILPVLDMKFESGKISANLIVEYAEPGSGSEVDRQILERFDQYLVCGRLVSAELGWFLFHVPNAAKLREMQDLANELPGVTHSFTLPIVGFANLIGATYRRDVLLEKKKLLTVNAR